jgi:hypothetical protein
MEWEVTTVVLGPSEQQTEATNALRGQGWQAYAVTWTPTCGYTAWFRRPAATRARSTNPGQRVVTCRPTLQLTATSHALFHRASAASRNDASTTIMASDAR